MKVLSILALALVPAASFAADIEISINSVTGSGSGKPAVELMQALRDLGVKPQIEQGKENYDLAKGQITLTNGAACGNGKKSYAVKMAVVDSEMKTLQQIDQNDEKICDRVSKAESFAKMLDKWGANKLSGDCDSGHCYTSIDMLSCSRNSPRGGDETCVVTTSSGKNQQE